MIGGTRPAMFNEKSETTRNEVRDDVYGGRSLVAVFETVENARRAARALHEEGFHDVWLGVTRASDDASASGESSIEGRTVESAEGESLGERIARFFGGGGKHSLYDELVRHGVASSEARRIDL